MSYQTFIVFALAVGNTAITLIAANTQQLGIANPWILLVVLPTAVFTGTLAANQLKTIGSQAPNTITKTETVTTLPPDPPKP